MFKNGDRWVKGHIIGVYNTVISSIINFYLFFVLGKASHPFLQKFSMLVMCHPIFSSDLFERKISCFGCVSVTKDRKDWCVLPPPFLCCFIIFHILSRAYSSVFFICYKVFIGGYAIKVFCLGVLSSMYLSLVGLGVYSMSPYKTIKSGGDCIC